MAWAMDQTVCNRNRSRHEPEVQHRLVQSYPSPGVHSFIHSPAERCLAPAPSREQGRLFTPRQAGDEFWFQAGLSVRGRKYQRAGEENCTEVCWLEYCFDEGGGLKLIVLEDNRAGDFPTEN